MRTRRRNGGFAPSACSCSASSLGTVAIGRFPHRRRLVRRSTSLSQLTARPSTFPALFLGLAALSYLPLTDLSISLISAARGFAFPFNPGSTTPLVQDAGRC